MALSGRNGRIYRRSDITAAATSAASRIYAMMNFVAFAQAAQNGNRVFHVRLIHNHGLKPPLKRVVFFYVFSDSSSVVAPMQCSSPLASKGLNRFPASCPSAAPAPTTVCSSSIKRIMLPFESDTSLSTAFSRSSNSPLNFARQSVSPCQAATQLPVFKIFRHIAVHDTIARPSAIAVLPTPGSPIRTGLFFVRRERIS